MAKFLGYVSNIVLSIDAVVEALLQVKLIDNNRLFAIMLDSMTREDHDDEEVLFGGSLDSFLEV